MSQIIAVQRSKEIELMWDSYVSDEASSYRLIAEDNGKVFGFSFSNNDGSEYELAIGGVGTPIALQTARRTLELHHQEAEIEPTSHCIQRRIVPMLRDGLIEADLLEQGEVRSGGEVIGTMVVAISNKDAAVMAILTQSLSTLTYAEPFISLGSQSDSARALWLHHQCMGIEHDHAWMKHCLEICSQVSQYVKPPFRSLVIGGK